MPLSCVRNCGKTSVEWLCMDGKICTLEWRSIRCFPCDRSLGFRVHMCECNKNLMWSRVRLQHYIACPSLHIARQSMYHFHMREQRFLLQWRSYTNKKFQREILRAWRIIKTVMFLSFLCTKVGVDLYCTLIQLIRLTKPLKVMQDLHCGGAKHDSRLSHVVGV